MASTQVTYKVDFENNAEQWWDALRAALPGLRDGDPEVYDLCRQLEREDEVTIGDPRTIERFDAFVTGLPGWADGPEHAREALIAHAE